MVVASETHCCRHGAEWESSVAAAQLELFLFLGRLLFIMKSHLSRTRLIILAVLFVLWSSACSQPKATATVEAGTATPASFTPATETTPPAMQPEETQPANEDRYEAVEEAILILKPGTGSRLLSPLRVSGFAAPTFEQHLLVQVLLDDGRQLAAVPTIIQADAGERGPFSVEIPFEIEGERQAFILVTSDSPRDGGITHLASVGVTLAAGGAEEIKSVEPHPERIVILQPTLGAVVSGGLARVSGFALASFEQTLVVEVLDETGNVIGSLPVVVEAPEWGQPGPFNAEVAYTLAAPGAGRIVVRDPSVVFEGNVHLASVEVRLEP